MSDEESHKPPSNFIKELWCKFFTPKKEVPNNNDDAFARNVVTAMMNVDVSDLMVHRHEASFVNVAIRKEEALQVLHRLCKEPDNFYRAVPICEGDLDAVCGYVDICDLIEFCISDNSELNLHKCLKKVVFVAPSMKAMDLLERFRQTGQSIAVVLDEYGGTEGIVSLDRAIAFMAGTASVDRSPSLTSGKCELSGRSDLKALESNLGVSLAIDDMPDDIETLGGLIMFMLGRVPEVGERISHASGVTFSITEATAKAIVKVLVEVDSENKQAP